MTPDPEPQKDSSQPGSPGTDKNRWLIAVFVVVALILVGIIAYAILYSPGRVTAPEPTQPAVFISITEPVQGALLDLTWAVTVKGQGGGLFEGNLVIQALDAAGNVLAQQPTTINALDAGVGGSGSWAVDLRINAEQGTQGRIVALSTSPEDGSIVAADSINVGYGESPGKDELVMVEDHLWRLALLNGRTLIETTFITLMFNNFQASGTGGCNLYNTSYEHRGFDLNFGFVTSTAKECELPEGIMAQEAAFFNALEQVVAYRIENQQFNLFDGSGDLLLVYEAVVIGSIVSSNETEIPEDAVVYISLSDVSLADGEAPLVAEQVIMDATQFPIPFTVTYNPREIIENHTYAIGVRIEDNTGNLIYINPTAYHIITGGNPSHVDVLVEAVQ